MPLRQQWTKPRHQVAQTATFCMLAPNVCGSSFQERASMSPSWHLEFWGDSQINGKFVHPWSACMLKATDMTETYYMLLFSLYVHPCILISEWCQHLNTGLRGCYWVNSTVMLWSYLTASIVTWYNKTESLYYLNLSVCRESGII